MVRAFGFCALALASCAWAGTEPKPKPSDYPVQARVGDIDIGAAYLVHTLPAERTNFLAPDYLAVEIAIYPPKSQAVTVAAGQFRLRMNGKKEAPADTPEMVAMSLNYPGWEGRRIEPQVGVGPVILGGQQPGGRFPGDPRATGPQRPQTPKAGGDQPTDSDRPPPQSAAEAAVALAFQNGPCERPVSGYLYFRYDGKVKSIKSLDLIWQRGEERSTIRLF